MLKLMKIYPVTFVFIFTVSLTLSCIRLTLNPDIDIKSKVIDADTKQPVKGCDIILVGVYYRVTSPPDYFSNCDTLKNSDKFQPMLENYIRNYNPEEKTMYKTQTDDNGVFLITNIKTKTLVADRCGRSSFFYCGSINN